MKYIGKALLGVVIGFCALTFISDMIGRDKPITDKQKEMLINYQLRHGNN